LSIFPLFGLSFKKKETTSIITRIYIHIKEKEEEGKKRKEKEEDKMVRKKGVHS
jgi:hypothetical protein